MAKIECVDVRQLSPGLVELLTVASGPVVKSETMTGELVPLEPSCTPSNAFFSADDVKNVDLTRVHYLSGPFEIESAQPGDVLILEIQDIQPMQEQPWGFTGVFDRRNGGGFLDEIYPNACVTCPDRSDPC